MLNLNFKFWHNNCYFPYTLRAFTYGNSIVTMLLKAPHFPMNFFALFSVPIETFPMLDN